MSNYDRDDSEVEPVNRAGYQRRSCSKCGEGLGFTESDPCERCSMEVEPMNTDKAAIIAALEAIEVKGEK